MTRKDEMLEEIRAAKAAGTTQIWYGHEENAEPVSIDAAINDIKQMDEDSIGEGSWGEYTVTLGQLIDKYQANGYIVEDDGNGAGYPTGGQFVSYDDDSDVCDIEMRKLDTPHTSADSHECEYVSDWITTGEGDNPYRFRVFF